MKSKSVGSIKLVLIVLITLLAIMGISVFFEIYVAGRGFKEIEREIEEMIEAEQQNLNAEARSEIQEKLLGMEKTYSELRGARLILDVLSVFVVVGGGVGGYLLSQSQANDQRKREVERQEIDNTISTIVKELASKDEPILRASAAVKFGQILENFPIEWEFFGDEQQQNDRKKQITDLIKSVLSASLSIEQDEQVLKRIADNLNKHQLVKSTPTSKSRVDSTHHSPGDIFKENFQRVAPNRTIHIYQTDMRFLDFSNIRGERAYWPKADFTGSDFYKAELPHACLKQSKLNNIRFRSTNFQHALLSESEFDNAQFKAGANLEKADFTRSSCYNVRFEQSNLRNINFSKCNLEQATFLDVDLTGANFSEANLKHVNFKNVILNDCKFDRAIFKETMLNGTAFAGNLPMSVQL